MAIVWEHEPGSSVWFYQADDKSIWANVSHPRGALVLALVQPRGAPSSTGSFETVARAQSWCGVIIAQYQAARQRVRDAKRKTNDGTEPNAA